MFGANASLELSGSFHVTTADYLGLGTSDPFYADPAQTSLLFTESPVVFGFLDDTIASVTYIGDNFTTYSPESGSITTDNSTLVVNSGSISIIGNEIFIDGAAIDQNGLGRFNLASIASAGEVRLENDNLTLDGEGGGITIQNSTRIFVDDYTFIRGGDLVLNNDVSINNIAI
ncbi:MAG: hypothetical protein GY869_25980, partial [Planctomycetes bacterium]|nr:hypothetical protein [Planctomycetota bacterium]